MIRYGFDEVKAALREHWGLSLLRGGEIDEQHDGRWATEYSRTGYLVAGNLPGRGYGYHRFRTLIDVVRACNLTKLLTENPH